MNATTSPVPEPVLLEALRSPLCYEHPVGRVRVIETHISWVVLAGDFAYKLKKPVDLGFLDFSTLERRRACCEAEVRLNRRTAPRLYLGVAAIGGTPSAPRVGGDGDAIEYAVQMRRFAQEDVLDQLARRGRLGPADMDALGASIADFHARAERCTGPADADELGLALDNVAALRGAGLGLPAPTLDALEAWTVAEHAARSATLARRRAEGFVRDVHGDLHLGNLVMVEGKPVAFDCIEFNDALRRIDVMSDVAFVVMDLHHHGLPRLAARFLDAYLAGRGDYAGVAVLRFFAVYRALVRAKVLAISAHQAPPGSARAEAALEDARAHVRLAQALAAPREDLSLTVMHGLSGSGKSTVALRLVEDQGAVRLRSDVERKRMHGLELSARAAAPPGEGLYTQSRRQAVYERLADLAGEVLAAGCSVIVDAAFLRRAERDRFRDLARAAGCGFRIVTCVAPEAELRRRLVARAQARSDPSDAGPEVLASQAAEEEPVGADERGFERVVDTSKEGAA